MKLSLKRIFPFLYKTRFNVLPEHEVELAFVSGGVEYFQFVNGFHCYSERYFAATDAILALEQRVDKQYLKVYVGLMNEYLNKGNLTAAAVLNHNLEERIDHLCNVDLLYQLASVWYFDKNENCYSYNPEYAEKKIALWRKDKEALAFFLANPLKQYMPLHDTFITNSLQTYTRAQRLELLQTLKYHSSLQSETPNNKELLSSIQSKIQ